MYINKVFIFGNLTRDPELKTLPSGTAVASFGVATNRVWRDKSGQKQEGTEFHNVVVFGKQAETVSQYLTKGSSVFIEGRLQTRSWEAADGAKKNRTEIVAERVQFGPRKGPGGPAAAQAPVKEEAGGKAGELDTIEYPEEEINPEEIPF